MRKRRRFSQEFKIEAMRMVVEQGRDLYDVWKRKFEEDGKQAFPGSGHLKPEDEENRRLRRENERLRMERDILKKAVAIFSDRLR